MLLNGQTLLLTIQIKKSFFLATLSIRNSIMMLMQYLFYNFRVKHTELRYKTSAINFAHDFFSLHYLLSFNSEIFHCSINKLKFQMRIDDSAGKKKDSM